MAGALPQHGVAVVAGCHRRPGGRRSSGMARDHTIGRGGHLHRRPLGSAWSLIHAAAEPCYAGEQHTGADDAPQHARAGAPPAWHPSAAAPPKRRRLWRAALQGPFLRRPWAAFGGHGAAGLRGTVGHRRPRRPRGDAVGGRQCGAHVPLHGAKGGQRPRRILRPCRCLGPQPLAGLPHAERRRPGRVPGVRLLRHLEGCDVVRPRPRLSTGLRLAPGCCHAHLVERARLFRACAKVSAVRCMVPCEGRHLRA
mmetsp:Transcript_74696/g.216775  ORF Transcript_74696/g.216775 Transcript_74696/m.216775 type:complete len:253 (+) Transcript_74696:1556-2314(+)